MSNRVSIDSLVITSPTSGYASIGVWEAVSLLLVHSTWHWHQLWFWVAAVLLQVSCLFSQPARAREQEREKVDLLSAGCMVPLFLHQYDV